MKIFLSILLMALGNVLMTTAWYWHLGRKAESFKAVVAIILTSWAIAFFEYCLLVPANRIGSSAGLSAFQLKIIQEVLTLSVFVPFALLVLHEKWRWDYLWAFICVFGAVYFVNRA